MRNNAANIHTKEDWNVIFTLLEVVGAGASPDVSSGLGADEDSGQGGTDDEKIGRERGGSGGWVDLGREGGGSNSSTGYSIVHTRQIVMHCRLVYRMQLCILTPFFTVYLFSSAVRASPSWLGM